MASYLALTAHWISLDATSACPVLRAALIGFHPLKKSHTGANIGRIILHLLDRAGVTSKVCISNSIYSLALLTFHRSAT